MATRTVTIHDHCTTPGCGKRLYSIGEGESGKCSTCWVASLEPDTKKALNRLIASAFNGSTDQQKGAAVDDAMAKLKRDRGE